MPTLVPLQRYGKRYTVISKDCFETLESPKQFKLSSTGFNLSLISKQDPTLAKLTHQYGLQTIQNVHPCLKNIFNESTYKSAFKGKEYIDNPVDRSWKFGRKISFLEPTSKRSFSLNRSGYVENLIINDGRPHYADEWKNDNNAMTEYKNKFLFPRIRLVPLLNQGRLKRKSINS